MHGGAAGCGAPQGNQNATKHGAFRYEARRRQAETRKLIREAQKLVKELQRSASEQPGSVCPE
jgi:glucans biosynthesis protein